MDKREKVIKGIRCCAIEGVGDCVNCPYDDMGFNCDIEMMNDALELLKAQEPVEPIERNGFYYCGKCRYAFTVHRQKYCSDCGQAVKWDG